MLAFSVPMGDPAKIIELRQLLSEKFPQAGPRRGDVLPTGLPRLDQLLDGGLWKGALTELVAPPTSSGSALCLHTLLHTMAAAGQWMALIDGLDSFDPTSIDNAVLAHLLWVRCRNTTEALRAADLLARDGNLPLIALDLRQNEAVHKLPSSAWYRLQRLVEQHTTTLLVVTPRHLVPSAHVQLTLENSLPLTALNTSQRELLDQLQIQLARRRFLAPAAGTAAVV